MTSTMDRRAAYEQRTDRHTVRVRMSPDELAALDAIRRPGETRSDAIRRAVAGTEKR